MYSRLIQRGNRRVAFILGMICLWMSAGAVLAHTDDLHMFAKVAVGGRATLGHAHLIAPDGPCAACEWTQAARTLHSPTLSVASVALVRTDRPLPVPAALHLRAFTHTFLRAPPVS